MISRVVSAAMLLTASLAAYAGNAPHWEYEGKYGPAKWGQLESGFALCGMGKEQSPIDIRKATKSSLAPLEFGYTASSAENKARPVQSLNGRKIEES